MTGVFVADGMDLQVRNIKIPLGGSPPPPVSVRVRLDTWQHWLLVACDNTTLASTEESVLRQQIGSGTSPQIDEFKALTVEANSAEP